MNDKPLYKETISSQPGIDDDANRHLQLLQSCLRITYTAPKTMHWVAKVLSKANSLDPTTKMDGEIIIQLLEKYCCERIKNASNYDKSIKINVAKDFNVGSGFNIERIVFTYLDYILLRDHASDFDAKDIKEFQFQFRNSIEHFFPQNPYGNSNNVTKDHRDSFGNLALITVSANSKFSNLLPSSKKNDRSEIIKQSPKLMKMVKLMGNNEWNDTLVQQHGDEMLELLYNEIKSKTVQEESTINK